LHLFILLEVKLAIDPLLHCHFFKVVLNRAPMKTLISANLNRIIRDCLRYILIFLALSVSKSGKVRYVILICLNVLQ